MEILSVFGFYFSDVFAFDPFLRFIDYEIRIIRRQIGYEILWA